jgi:hypothetical protein
MKGKDESMKKKASVTGVKLPITVPMKKNTSESHATHKQV